MLILEIEGEGKGEEAGEGGRETERQTESRRERQITTAEDQPSTQFQTGKGMWGEAKGRMSDLRKGCREEKRETVFEGDIWL